MELRIWQITFINAYSFSAARRDMYIQDAEFRLRK